MLYFVWISNGYHIELSMNYILFWLCQLVLTAPNNMCTAPATETEENVTGTCCVIEFYTVGQSGCATCKQIAVKLFLQKVSQNIGQYSCFQLLSSSIGTRWTSPDIHLLIWQWISFSFNCNTIKKLLYSFHNILFYFEITPRLSGCL